MAKVLPNSPCKCGNPMPSVKEKVRCEEDEEITKRGRTKRWPGLRDELSGSILDLCRDCAQASRMRQTEVPPPVFLRLGQYCAEPADSPVSDILPPSPS